MNKLKVIMIILLATAITIVILLWFLRKYTFRSIQFAFMVNFLLLDWVAIVSGALGERYRFYFPKSYYRPKRFERDGRIYKLIGVHYFKKLVAKGPLAVLASIRFHGKRSQIGYYYKETLWGEVIHGIQFVLILALALFAVSRSWWKTSVYLMVPNTVINFYPVILQRYNRFRLLRVMALEKAIRARMDDSNSVSVS